MNEDVAGNINDLVLDLMTYQAFVAAVTHIPDMMANEGLTFQECLLRVMVETCESEFAFAAIQSPTDGCLRPFATYPDPLPVALPRQLACPVLLRVVEHERSDVLIADGDPERQIVAGIRTALAVPYRNRGARCVVCVCNRNEDSFARPNLGIPYVSHEVKMCQALMQVRPV